MPANFTIPDLVRLVHAACERCGRESSYCAKVQLALNYKSTQVTRPMLCCATCRLEFPRRWKIAEGWQEPILAYPVVQSPAEWAEWCKANPPLEETFDE